MPLLIPIALPLIVVASVLVCMVLQQTANVWLRPIIKALTANHRSFWLKIVTAPVKIVAKGIAAIEHSVSASLGSYAGAGLKPITAWLNGLAVVAGETPLHIGGLAQATYEAFNILRHKTVPKLIKLATDPINVIAVRADKLAKETDARLDGLSVNLGKALEVAGFGVWAGISNQLVGFVKAMDNLHGHVWQNITPDVNALKAKLYGEISAQLSAIQGVVTVDIPQQLIGIRTRLGQIESVLAGLGDIAIPIPDVPSIPIPGDIGSIPGTILDRLKALADPVVFAGAAVAAITAFAPQLFCRNTLRAAEKVCAADDDLLDGLLSGLILVTGVISIEEIVREAQALTGTVVGALDGLE